MTRQDTIEQPAVPTRAGPVKRPSAPVRYGSHGRRLLTFGLAAVMAAIVYLLHPGRVTDDTYAFLDWGRDLRHGYPLLLENRTFHPVPVLAGAVLSVFDSAAPTITVLLCLMGLVLAAIAAWRITALLGFGVLAAALAALLVLATPLLPVLALVAYINLPFGALILWAVVFALEERRAAAWTALVTAGLIRPEGWAFLLAYGAFSWWHAGRPYAPRRWLGIFALSLGPMALWVTLEWRLFGSPFYSLKNTTGSAVRNTHSGTPRALWETLRMSLTLAPLIAGAVGAIAVAWLAPRRLAVIMLGATAVAAATILILAGSNFNVPARHFSALLPLICVLAAAGATVPARMLARVGVSSALATVAVSLAGAAVVLVIALPSDLHELKQNLAIIATAHEAGRTLSQVVARARQRVDARGAGRHSVAMIDARDRAELAWFLGVPFNAVAYSVEAGTRLVVEPAPAMLSPHRRATLVGGAAAAARGWRLITGGAWDIYAIGARTPVRLGGGP